MVDYFDAPGPSGAVQADTATANGAAQPFTNGAGDLGMDDISVSRLSNSVLVTTMLMVRPVSEREKRSTSRRISDCGNN